MTLPIDDWISGMKLVVNATKPENSRVESIEIHCGKCTPAQYEAIDLDRSYRIVANDFLLRGGNGYEIFAENAQNVL